MAHTIAAAATPAVSSAIGILRLSGDDCFSVVQNVFRAADGRRLSDCPPRTMIYGDLLDETGRTLDRVLCVLFAAPHSYTGENAAELHCHGSPAVLAAGLRALFRFGAVQAQPGEFTRRAFLAGKMDLTQAEAVIDLIEAQTADEAANAASQVAGALREKVEPVCDALVDVLSHFHAELDYPDDEIEPFVLEEARAVFENCRKTLSALTRSFERGNLLKNGVKAVILGKPNVGKSSLLNALAGYERVIVTELAGTTRDTVEFPLRLGGCTVRLCDTAGIRQTADKVESLGVELSRRAAAEAELAFCIFDGTSPLTDDDRAAICEAKKARVAIGVINKADLPCVLSPEMLPFEEVIAVSAKTGEQIERLDEVVAAHFSVGVCDGSIVTNARQHAALDEAERSLSRALSSMDGGMTPDAVLCDAEAALEALGAVTGRTVREDVVTRIFERFCVGK